MKRLDELRREVGRALKALEVAADMRGHDGWIDPASLTVAIESGEPTLLRGAPPLDEVSAEGYAEPRDPWWLLLGQGAEVQLAPMRLGLDEAAASATVTRVVVEIEQELCCDARRCDQQKSLASVWLEIGADGAAVPKRLLVGEHLGRDDEEVRAAVSALASALARRLDVPLEGAEKTGPEVVTAADDTAVEGLSALALSRWSLRREGEVFVLRDHATRGPRETAATEGWLSLLLGAAALTTTYFAVTAGLQQSYQRLAILGIVAAVLAAASYAMARIAAHSRSYRARHAALATLARDRLVLAPWHTRSGAISPEPEGRFGAAVRIGEVESLHAVPEGELISLRYETAHGPYEVGLLEDAEQARLWTAALRRIAEQVVHVEAARALSKAAGRRTPKGAVVAATLALLACIGCQGAAPVPGPRMADASPPLKPAPEVGPRQAALRRRPPRRLRVSHGWS